MGDIGPIRRITHYPDLEPETTPDPAPVEEPVPPKEPDPLEPERVPA